MGKKIKLTTAQAIIKFIQNQYVSIDGQETQFVKGVYTIYGHGNVLGLGEALENYNEIWMFIKVRMRQVWGLQPLPSLSKN